MIILVVAAVGVAALRLVDWPQLKGWANEQARGTTGRDLAIDGRLSIDLLSWTPSLIAERVRLSNPPWASRPDMATIGRLSLVIDLKAILRGQLRITDLRVQDIDLRLEENGDGRANWQFGATDGDAAAVEAVVPEDRGDLPRIERVDVERGRLTYLSPKLAEPIVAEFNRIKAENRPDRLILAAAGTYQQRSFDLDAEGGGISLLRDEAKPYPLTVALVVGSTKARLSGTMVDPIQFLGFDAELALAGNNLAELFPILGLPLPSSPAYELEGRLTSSKGLWRLDDFTGRLGGSDMRGMLVVETGREVPLLRADVTSTALRIEDLQGFVGEDDDAGKRRASARGGDDEGGLVLPREPFNLEKMKALDAEVQFEGKRIVTGGMWLNDVATRFTLKGGRLVVDPVRFGVVGGSVAGMLVIDASRRIPELRADLKLRRLDFAILMQGIDPQKVSTGKIGGRTDIVARGRSVREMALNAEGRVLAYMSGGTIGNQILEMIALDLPQLVADWFSGGGEVWAINCAIFPFTIRDGVIGSNHLLLDAPYDTIVGMGHIDLASERLEFKLTSKPRDFSLFNTPSVITVRGSLAERRANVDTLEVIGETLKKLLLAPFTPFTEMAPDEIEPCRPVARASAPPARR